MSDGSIWDGAFDDDSPRSTSGVSPYFERQCAEVERISGGRVHARFASLQMAPKFSWPGLPAADMVEKNALDRQDINDFYNPSTYAFDIYNDVYKFRVLTMELGAVYPVRVALDGGIEGDLGKMLGDFTYISDESGDVWIEDDEQLASFMGMVVGLSPKLRCILKRLSSGQ